MYDQAIATLAVVEALRTRGDIYRKAARKGIDFLVMAQNPGWGWRYSVRPGDNDSSVTGWCLRALRVAETTGLEFPRASYDGAEQWFQRVTGTHSRLLGYEAPGDEGSFVPGMNDRWQKHPVMTAIGLNGRIAIGKQRDDPWLALAADALLLDLPSPDVENRAIDYYYWNWGIEALLAYAAPDGPAWKQFREKARTALLSSQEKPREGRCSGGSWDPAADKWGVFAGRVYATALNVITLERCGKD